MTHTLFIHDNRVQCILNELKSKAKVIGPTKVGLIEVEITIDNSMDILSMFHAGVHSGADEVKKGLGYGKE